MKPPPAFVPAAFAGRGRCGGRSVGVSQMGLRRARRPCGGPALWLTGLLLATGVAGCNGAIETYRSVSGMNKNDPDPAHTPYTENLEKAEAGSYPNLADVPPIPTIASTASERQKLAQDLSGVRTSAEANGGTANPGPVPPPPPIPPGFAAVVPASPPPPPSEKPGQNGPPRRAMDEPPTPSPPNATLQTPAIATLPGIEASRPAPAPGHPSAMPRPAPSAMAAATLQSANPHPTPPPASLPPPQVEPQVAALPPPKLPPVPTTVASFDFAPGANQLPGDAPSRLAPVVAQYKEKPRTVRIVAYAQPGTGGAEQLNSFRGALDRAQLVSKALADAGIPPKQIQTEASPATTSVPPGRIEVQLLP